MKCAIVTGGSRGIGRAICLRLADEKKYHLLVNYAGNQAAAEETKKLIEEKGGTAEILKFDVSNGDETRKILGDWQEKNPDAVMEIIVNNAGITRDGLFMWMQPDDWSQVIKTSIDGFYNVTNFFIQKMLSKRYGRIISIVSVSGLKGTAGQTNYSAAKSAVIGATKALAQEVAKRNITVNAIAPGFISTDMTSDFNEAELKAMIPANRFGKAEEVAHLAAFLASPNAAYITGEVININGGLYS